MTTTRLCDNMILHTTIEDPAHTAPAGTTARDGISEAMLSNFTSTTMAATLATTTSDKPAAESASSPIPNNPPLPSLITSSASLCQTSRPCHHDTRWGESVVGDTGGNSPTCGYEGVKRAIVDSDSGRAAVDSFSGAQAQTPALSLARNGRELEEEQLVCCTSVDGRTAARVFAATTSSSCLSESPLPSVQLSTDTTLPSSLSSSSSSSSTSSTHSSLYHLQSSLFSAPSPTAATHLESSATTAATSTAASAATAHELQEHQIAFEGDLLSRPPAQSRLSLTLPPPQMGRPSSSHSSSTSSSPSSSSPSCSRSALSSSSSSSSSSLSSTFSAWSSFSSARSLSTSCSTPSDASPSPFFESLPPPLPSSRVETHPAPSDPSTVNTAPSSIHCADTKAAALQEHRASGSKLIGPSVDTETGTIPSIAPEAGPCLSLQEHTQDSQTILEHPHIIYPHTQYSDTPASPPVLPLWTPSSDLHAQNPWDSYQERCDDFDENEDDAASDERQGLFSQESDDSDPELKRAQDHHQPTSIKRRKVSVDEVEILEDEEEERSPAARPSSGRAASSAGGAERQSRPASWPARKRRSLLPDHRAMDPTLQERERDQQPQPQQQHEQHEQQQQLQLQQQPSCTPDLTSNLDTSSLSLLSATSALVSAGADLSLDLDSQVPVASAPLPSAESSCRQVPVFSVSLLQDLSPPSSSPSSSSFPIRSATATTGTSTSCKRSFEEAIELTRPLGNDPALDHSGWFKSNKRRKVHHYPMRWTSTLSPSPYVKLMSMRDFWDVMRTRIDLSWLDLWTVLNANSQSMAIDWCQWRREAKGNADQDFSNTVFTSDQALSTPSGVATSGNDSKHPKCLGSISEFRTQKTVMQHPSVGLLLKGLWEEEEKVRRKRQMIPEGVHKPMRSKILTRKPLPRIGALRIPSRSILRESETLFQQSTSSCSSSSSTPDSTDATPSALAPHNSDSDCGSWSRPPSPKPSQEEYDEVVRRKNGVTTAVPAHALSEGYDLGDYKPWKDGTVLPHQGSIPGLNQLRQSTLMEPWPLEETQAKDECTRMLHRMREQLNVVINLQIHLRSLVRSSAFGTTLATDAEVTASEKESAIGTMTPCVSLPSSSQMSFLLSVRHPGQVSIELLRALYGPGFLQTSAFHSIEQLLWGPHLHVHRERLPSAKVLYHSRYSSSHDGNEYRHQGSAEYDEYQSRQGAPMYNNSSSNSSSNSHHHEHHYRHHEDHGYDHGFQHEHEHEHAMEAPLDSDHSTESLRKETFSATLTSNRMSMMVEGNESQTRENTIQELEVGYGNRF